MDMRRLVGSNVLKHRQKKGFSQERLAELCGFSQQYLSGLEQGKRNPTIVTIYEIASALDVDFRELLRPGRQRLKR